MLKATSTFTQAKNIAMALTMSFAAATLVTACGNDESTDTTQSSAAEMSSEDQNNMTENSSQVTLDSEDTMKSESVAEQTQTDTNAEADEDVLIASDDASDTQANEQATDEAETHKVTAQGLVYAPLVVNINSGDSVAWRNMATHNTESLEGLIPKGAEKWSSPIGKSYTRAFTQEGIYVYKCTPHFGAGMGGAIIVGEPVNLEQLKNADAKGAAGRLVRKAIAEAETM